MSSRRATVPISRLNMFKISSSRKASDLELTNELNRDINPETPWPSIADNAKILLPVLLRGANLTPCGCSVVNRGVQLSLSYYVSTTDWGLSWAIWSRTTEWKLLDTVLVLGIRLEAEFIQIAFLSRWVWPSAKKNLWPSAKKFCVLAFDVGVLNTNGRLCRRSIRLLSKIAQLN